MKLRVSRKYQYPLFSLMTAALCSCSLLTPVNIEKTKYLIDKTPPPFSHKKNSRVSLLVLNPQTNPVYKTTKMAYSIEPHQVAYFSENEWGASPANMFKPLMVKTLQNANYFHAVVTAPTISKYQYILSTKIVQFKQDYTMVPSKFALAIEGQLINVATKKVIASKQFNYTQPMVAQDPRSGVIAANNAAIKFLAHLRDFCINNT
jgi:cholesterol transport system auxiliary component